MRFISHKYWNLLITLILLLSVSCSQEDEIAQRSFPRVSTLQAPHIDNESVILKGEILQIPPSTTIIDHGFIITPDKVGITRRVSLGTKEGTGMFEAKVETGLSKGEVYHFSGFVQTSANMVYGNPITFTSKGSKAPL